MKYKVSILIPVYNTEKYLKKCLDSVVNQTLREIEIVIVNDGSTDNSQVIIEEYAKKDKRIKYHIQENSGLGATRNKGIELATSDYIAFLDSDDWVELDCYEKMYNKAILNNVDLIISDYYVDYTNNSYTYKNIYTNKELYLENVILRNIAGFSWNKLYKKSIIDDNKMSFPVRGELENVEDQFFTTRFLQLSKNIEFVNQPLIHYIIRNSSIVNSYQKGLINDGLELYNQNNKFFNEQNVNKKIYELLDISLLKHSVQVILNEAKTSNKIKLNDKIANIRELYKNSIYKDKIWKYTNKKINLDKLSKIEKMYISLLSKESIYILYFISRLRVKLIEWRIKSYE